ncbi:integrase [Siccirubricoccus deserti]|uniref:Site-specific integrase n=1 Tax=Siccirubricoccus deserti TaxID=2013562 RepID=A0A9X0QZH2_9PROT|nr:site-specific integrase [Siccirubricoccus deserti]MBC4015907.1 site-specific integrase [Siccirubricoccus deserti]GGC45523.1 integrase [Siccirubricoccus deserti]
MATVYRRGSTWWVRFVWRGAEVRRSARTSSKAVAQRVLARLLDEHRRLDHGGRPRRTYREALERFSTDYLPTLKPSTQSRYRTSFRQLAAAFGDLYLDEINRSRLADYATARLKAGAKGATVRRDLATLSCLCSCAVTWDYSDLNPVRQFSRRYIRESAPRTAYPSVEQVERLVENAPAMAGRIICFLAQTGMRMDEVCSLEWSQVSIPRREVRLTKTKTSSPRVVPLSDAALGTILGTPRHITSPYVFWHGDGERYTAFTTAFRKIAARAGVPFRCHDLRHHFASEFLMATSDIAALRAILGHKTITMTMRYSHLMTDHLHRAMGRFGAGNPGTNPGTKSAETSPSPSDDADQPPNTGEHQTTRSAR